MTEIYCTIKVPEKAHGKTRGKLVKSNRKGVFVDVTISWFPCQTTRTVRLEPNDIVLDVRPDDDSLRHIPWDVNPSGRAASNWAS